MNVLVANDKIYIKHCPHHYHQTRKTNMHPTNILEAAAAHMKDREATYDSPGGERSMEKTVSMFNTLLGKDRVLTTEQGWMFMAILKIVRSQQGDFRADNYEDLAAYAALAAEEGFQIATKEKSQTHNKELENKKTVCDSDYG